MIDSDLIRSILATIDDYETQGICPVGSERLTHLEEKNTVLLHLHYLIQEGFIKGQEIRTGVGGISLQRIALIQLTSAGRKALQPRLAEEASRLDQPGSLIRQTAGETPLLVFISSTIERMKNERKAAEDAIGSIPLTRPWLFEKTSASSEQVEESYLKKVKACDMFVMLVGADYSSAVAYEYETAQKAEKPILVFIKRVTRDEAQEVFVKSIVSKYVLFDGPADLFCAVQAAVGDEVTRQFRTARQSDDPSNDRLFQLYISVCKFLRERGANVWCPEIGSQEHWSAERMVEKGLMERAPGIAGHYTLKGTFSSTFLGNSD